MLEKVIENWTSRLDYIRASRGSPMPEIIFKMFLVFTAPRPFAGEKFKSGSPFVDLPMIVSWMQLPPQPLSLVSPKNNRWCGCPAESVASSSRSSDVSLISRILSPSSSEPTL
ncbi:hypothetical protein TNCV_4875131 [Trichonephila clavipes]|nr:hypothetical protein TNCV_4875131 [Trichonephila clavipes]